MRYLSPCPFEIPVVVGAANATHILKGGSVVTIDAARGIVY